MLPKVRLVKRNHGSFAATYLGAGSSSALDRYASAGASSTSHDASTAVAPARYGRFAVCSRSTYTT